jgi:hypothetical protein
LSFRLTSSLKMRNLLIRSGSKPTFSHLYPTTLPLK